LEEVDGALGPMQPFLVVDTDPRQTLDFDDLGLQRLGQD
jgi:hypothetical protein